MGNLWNRVDILLGDRSDSWLATQLGINRSTLATWKHMERIPKGDVIFRLAKILEVAPEVLLDTKPKTPDGQPVHQSLEFLEWAGRNQGLLTDLLKLDPAQAAEVTKYVDYTLTRK